MDPSKETNPSGSATPQGDKPQTDQVSKAEFEKLEANYKALQRDLEKERKKGNDTSTLDRRLMALEGKLDRLGLTVGPLVESVAAQAEGDDHPLKKAVRQAKELGEKDRLEASTRAAQVEAYLRKVDAAVKEAGITDTKDERLVSIYDAWNHGDYEDALVEAKLLSRTKEKPMDEKALEERLAKLVEAQVHQKLQEKGYFTLDTKTGNPSSGTFDREAMRKLADRMMKGEDAAYDEFRKLRQEGRVDEAFKKAQESA